MFMGLLRKYFDHKNKRNQQEALEKYATQIMTLAERHQKFLVDHLKNQMEKKKDMADED